MIVINTDPRRMREKVGQARRFLWDVGVRSHIVGIDTGPDTFFKTGEESVTFTHIYRAKGNEAGMVYIINAQDCHSLGRNLASIRNRIFSAITRSKAWVRVLGIGSGMRELTNEYEKLKGKNFELQFTYPDADQRNQLRIVHRDMTTEERGRVETRQQEVNSLVADLKSGSIRIEDLDPDRLAELRELIR